MKLSTLPIYPYARVLIQAAGMVDHRLRVTSFYRTRAEQTRLYNAWLARGKTGLPAAPPGRSMHELGEAIDIARPGVDPFKDDELAYLGNWWREAGLGWNESDPVHFQLLPIPQHAAGLAAGEKTVLRAPMPSGAADLPSHHPSVTRGLTDDTSPQLTSRGVAVIDSITRATDDSMRSQATDAVLGLAKGAGAAALAAGLAGGGIAGIASAAQAVMAAAPEAAPLAAAGIIASIIIPAIASGEMFSNKIDPYFDATTAAAQARARAQAALIKQDLAETGYKFARRTGVL